MNIIYETTKERGATILMPSSMVDSLNPSAATLAFALAGTDLPTSAVVDPRGAVVRQVERAPTPPGEARQPDALVPA
jgi:hypothetical protein